MHAMILAAVLFATPPTPKFPVPPIPKFVKERIEQRIEYRQETRCENGRCWTVPTAKPVRRWRWK
jgi:hypothetical protein